MTSSLCEFPGVYSRAVVAGYKPKKTGELPHDSSHPFPPPRIDGRRFGFRSFLPKAAQDR